MTEAALREEYDSLRLAAFAEPEALQLGQILVDLARAGHLPVVIDIRSADRCLFHAALPGAAPLNDTWARRKSSRARSRRPSAAASSWIERTWLRRLPLPASSRARA